MVQGAATIAALRPNSPAKPSAGARAISAAERVENLPQRGCGHPNRFRSIPRPSHPAWENGTAIHARSRPATWKTVPRGL